ncbi:hypothetical protein ACP4OV_011711 [Aristida adscensionis]
MAFFIAMLPMLLPEEAPAAAANNDAPARANPAAHGGVAPHVRRATDHEVVLNIPAAAVVAGGGSVEDEDEDEDEWRRCTERCSRTMGRVWFGTNVVLVVGAYIWGVVTGDMPWFVALLLLPPVTAVMLLAYWLLHVFFSI